MIKADHKKWARAVFNPYLNLLLKKNFSHFYLANKFPQIPEDCGLIITPNHISWWDGFFIDFVNRQKLNRRIHILMLEEQLAKYKFFRKLGAYSINHGNVKSLIETKNYTSQIISGSKNFAVIYPQGEIEAYEKRPLNIKEGLKFILKDSGKNIFVVPAGFKIQYYNKKDPAVIARFSEPLRAEDIISDYDKYKKIFTENLGYLSSAAFEKKFTEDLFL